MLITSDMNQNFLDYKEGDVYTIPFLHIYLFPYPPF